MPLADPSCSDCRFWRPYVPGGEDGDCRREPPTIVHQAIIEDLAEAPGLNRGTIQMATYFPITHEESWCGRFEPSARRLQAEVREYRIEREVTDLCATVAAVIAAEQRDRDQGDDGWPAADNARKALTQFDERLVRDVPEMVCEIRERAKALATSDIARQLIDGALAEASGEKGAE